MKKTTRRIGGVTAAALMLLATASPAAWALDPPVFDPGRDVPPPNSTPASEIPMAQQFACVASANLPNSQWTVDPAGEAFKTRDLNKLATGKRQTVAVLDTGVSPNLRLPGLTGAGDYIMGGDGLDDCDRHGTPIAGVIAGRPASGDGFSGVAPDAKIVSLRIASNTFKVADNALRNLSAEEKQRAVSTSSVRNLAKAVRRAADTPGVTVIAITKTLCFPVGQPVDDRSLAGALYYAAVIRNLPIVATAGNLFDADNSGQTKCDPNPGATPDRPSDPRGWGNAKSVSLPSMWSQFVISVGGSTVSGEPYQQTLPGPWIAVAAPSNDIVSLDPRQGATGGLTNGQKVKDGKIDGLQGAEYGAARVAGLAALIREKYPDLTAYQVKQRITATAHTPAATLNNLLGEGIVDPLGALSAVLPPGPRIAEGVPPRGVSAEPAPTPPDTLARNIAVGAMVAAIGTAIALAAVFSVTRKRRVTGEDVL